MPNKPTLSVVSLRECRLMRAINVTEEGNRSSCED